LNPRPRIFHGGVYIHSLNIDFRASKLIQAQLRCASLLEFHPTGCRQPRGTIPLVDALSGPAGEIREDVSRLGG